MNKQFTTLTNMTERKKFTILTKLINFTKLVTVINNHSQNNLPTMYGEDLDDLHATC